MVLDVLMRAVGLLEERKGAEGTVVRRARAVFSGVDGGGEGLPVAKLAERVGYHPDHLTRLLKKETGMTAGQLRAALRLKRAQAELEAGATVAEAAERSGFADANYFTRWFKRQTAKTPRAWRAGRE
jgi:AraC family L-rhamnose operon transcriptional activator RhaR